jgi:ferredoxin-NADP reductase
MQLRFVGKKALGADIVSFNFKPTEPLTWIAGQSIKLELDGPYGPIEHRFTIAAPPYAGVVTVTTRLSGSDYKNTLTALRPGDVVRGYGVEGDFVWRESSVPHVFVAAGIGITPFYAMLAERAHEGKPLTAHVIYASTNEFVYKDELEQWLIPTYIANHRLTVEDIPQTKGLVYLSGPSAMVDELNQALLVRGTPESRIVRDWFTGNIHV